MLRLPNRERRPNYKPKFKKDYTLFYILLFLGLYVTGMTITLIFFI